MSVRASPATLALPMKKHRIAAKVPMLLASNTSGELACFNDIAKTTIAPATMRSSQIPRVRNITFRTIDRFFDLLCVVDSKLLHPVSQCVFGDLQEPRGPALIESKFYENSFQDPLLNQLHRFVDSKVDSLVYSFKHLG